MENFKRENLLQNDFMVFISMLPDKSRGFALENMNSTICSEIPQFHNCLSNLAIIINHSYFLRQY